MPIIKLGTRGSALALTQSKWVAHQIEQHNEGIQVELLVIKTTGDRDQKSALNKFAGKGIFTKEIEEALLAGSIDLAVHSLKDLPTTLPQGLILAPPPKREDPRDLLVAKSQLKDLPQESVIGTGSARRREQLRLLRPDFHFEEIRGNVPTRIQKWRDGHCHATVLACAGVARLGSDTAGLQNSEAFPLTIEECVPAPCQGILGIEIRENDQQTLKLLETIACSHTEIACRAERAFLRELGGGCHIPAGAWARIENDTFFFTGFLAVETSAGHFEGHRIELSGTSQEAEKLGREAAIKLTKS